ncbi:MAG TPA: hypothetical protein RMH99_08725 [Sandaracinaceae bacterium LLY-WYZ-13_1]|nr:hypothetical protein [Sandaracinaceae bacterium LLY-WYZ-13_1]
MRRSVAVSAILLLSGCSLVVPGPDDFEYGAGDGGQPTDAGGPDDAGTQLDSGGGRDSGTGCSAGLSRCGSDCVDTEASADHCGECGNRCEDGRVCRDGACFDPVEAVSVGFYHSCAVTQSRSVFCWGSNEAGQLGNRSFVRSLEPVQVEITDVVTMDSYGRFFTSFAGYSCAVLGSGEVDCWGMNYAGQLGDDSMDPSNVPRAVPGVSGAADVATSNEFACAVVDGGAIDCWGTWFSDLHSPERVPGLVDDALSVDAGLTHACSVHSSGTVSCWGSNAAGQLGDESRSDLWYGEPVPSISGAVDVAAGGTHTCAIVGDGDLVCWGAANALGIGSDSDAAMPPTRISALSEVVSVATGLDRTCAIHGSGRQVSCWGPPDGGESATPRPVEGLEQAESIALGREHACAAVADGRVLCWGANQHGQLGDGSTEDRAAPTAVLGLP